MSEKDKDDRLTGTRLEHLDIASGRIPTDQELKSLTTLDILSLWWIALHLIHEKGAKIDTKQAHELAGAFQIELAKRVDE